MDVSARAERAVEWTMRGYALRRLLLHQASQHRGTPRQHAAGFGVFVGFSRQLYRQPCTARRHNFSRPWRGAHALSFDFGESRDLVYRGTAAGTHHLLFVSEWPVRNPPADRTNNISHLALCFDHGGGGFSFSQSVRVLTGAGG